MYHYSFHDLEFNITYSKLRVIPVTDKLPEIEHGLFALHTASHLRYLVSIVKEELRLVLNYSDVIDRTYAHSCLIHKTYCQK